MSKKLIWWLIVAAIGIPSLCLCGGAIYIAEVLPASTPDPLALTSTPRPTRTTSPTRTTFPTRTPRPTRTPQPDVGSKYTALVLCQELVSDRLKSPSSAIFAKGSESVMIESAPGVWTVSSWVDSQNGFGAMLRTSWTCKIEYEGKDRWQPLALDFE